MVSMTEKLSAVMQEIKDFKEESFKRLERIEQQTYHTIDRINKVEVDIALVTTMEKDCPAREYHKNESKATKWTLVAMVITLSINLIMFFTKL
jgi:hypothetical protein